MLQHSCEPRDASNKATVADDKFILEADVSIPDIKIGIILNVILLVVYVKLRLHHDPTNDFIPQIAIVDPIASFLVIIPSSVAALIHEWPLSDTFCTIHGILVTWFHLLSFALIILIFVERVVKAWNPQLHSSTFNTHLFVVVISVIVWAWDLLISLLPILGIGSIAFDTYQSQCRVDHQRLHVLTHVIFSMGLYCSPLICLICFSLLIEKRRRAIMHELNDERNKLIDLNDKKAAEGLPGGKPPLFKKNPNNNSTASSSGGDKVGPKGPCAKKVSREEEP
ncbi:hypothetical protein ACOMHN_024265 [Nucella lapillus]